MPHLKPQHQWIRGYEIETLAPGLRTLKFLGPCLDSRGDECRAAKKAFEEHEKKTEKLAELEKGEETQELLNLRSEIKKGLDIKIAYAIASIKQQYLTVLDDGDRYTAETKDSEEAWIEAFSHYFTEDDIDIIMLSFQAGMTMTREKAFGLMQQNKGLLAVPPQK